ncbi:MAG TPA: hypothetical protein VF857_05585 [Spirochaetota bacterium]
MFKNSIRLLVSAFLILLILQFHGLAKGLYEKDVIGPVWTESAGSEIVEYAFTKTKFTNKMQSMTIVFDIVKIDNVNQRIILFINKKYVPLWWEKTDADTLSVTQLENSLYSKTMAEAMKKAKPAAKSILTRKK